MRSIKLAVLVRLLLFCLSSLAEPIDMALPGRPSATKPTLPQPVFPKNDSSFTLPPAPRIVNPEQTQPSTVRILLRGLEFEGNTVFTDSQLLALAKPYLNRPVSLTDLEALRLAFTQHYINNGYINSGAVLPEQTFKNGVIRFKIIEGVLSTIQVSGTERLNSDYVSSRLRLGAQGPLNFQTLQERFQMLLTDPLIERMNGQLMPGQQPGESVFDVKVVRKRPYQVNLSFDNHRPPSVGAEQGTLSGWLRNLTGWGDEMMWDIIYSEGSLSGGGGLSLPLTAYDTRFLFDFNLSRTTALEQLTDLGIKSRYSSYNFALSQPLYQSLQHHLNFTSTLLSIRQNKMQLDGSDFPFSGGDDDNGRSQSTAVRNALDYSYQDEQQALAFRSTLSVGMNAFGATWSHNRSSDSDFVSWLNQLQYVRQVLDNGSQLLFNSTVQWSNDSLLPLERFALGGFNSVRGYRENELVRDEGFLLSLEFRYPLSDNGDQGFPGKLSLAPFMDYGAAWDHGHGKQSRTLHSLGAGLLWNPIKQVQAEIYYAHALNSPPSYKDSNLQDKGIHFSVNISAF